MARDSLPKNVRVSHFETRGQKERGISVPRSFVSQAMGYPCGGDYDVHVS